MQQVTITSQSEVAIKPLVTAAIRGELKLLEHGIKRTRERLAEFEQRFNMSSAEFERRYDGQDLKESLDFADWWMERKALHLLEDRHRTLSEARID